MKAKHVILSSILFSAVAMPMLASASGSSTGGSSVSTTSVPAQPSYWVVPVQRRKRHLSWTLR
jgi:hypothetical protein